MSMYMTYKSQSGSLLLLPVYEINVNNYHVYTGEPKKTDLATGGFSYEHQTYQLQTLHLIISGI